MLILGCNLVHLIDGDDKPLPTSSNDLAESNSVSCPILLHSLFCASIGDMSSLSQYPKFSILPPVANCITGDNVL